MRRLLIDRLADAQAQQIAVQRDARDRAHSFLP